MPTKDGYEGLRNQLEKLDWPKIYMYKFIVPIDKADKILDLFSKGDTTTKVSRNGNYISVTAKPFMYNAEKVIDKYKEAKKIEGIIML